MLDRNAMIAQLATRLMDSLDVIVSRIPEEDEAIKRVAASLFISNILLRNRSRGIPVYFLWKNLEGLVQTAIDRYVNDDYNQAPKF